MTEKPALRGPGWLSIVGAIFLIAAASAGPYLEKLGSPKPDIADGRSYEMSNHGYVFYISPSLAVLFYAALCLGCGAICFDIIRMLFARRQDSDGIAGSEPAWVLSVLFMAAGCVISAFFLLKAAGLNIVF